jgi:hypothetical protein
MASGSPLCGSIQSNQPIGKSLTVSESELGGILEDDDNHDG